ncbi:hypothetical protein ACWEVD_10905 [Nocardia thailandica]|uniref:hypothetical protein n=1 Tax=Nocardia thailandica TaxID=257275 RepID=UPI0012F9E530|nr:hypothetical protein [Nocardia thailandica]
MSSRLSSRVRNGRSSAVAAAVLLVPVLLAAGCSEDGGTPPAAAADANTAAALEKSLKNDFGVAPDQPLSTLLTRPGSTWPGHITAVTVQDRTAHVRTDLDSHSDIDKNLGATAATAIAGLVRRGSDEQLRGSLVTISVEDPAGARIGEATV